jgi:hypothetical protein
MKATTTSIATTIISIDDDIDSDDHGDDTTILYSINIIQLYFISLTSEYGLCLLVAEAVSWELVVGLTIHISTRRVCVVGPYIGASRLLGRGTSLSYEGIRKVSEV